MGVIVPEGEAAVTIIWSLAGHATPYVSTLGVNPVSPMAPEDIALAIEDIIKATDAPADAQKLLGPYRYEGVNVSLMTPSGPLLGSASHPTGGLRTGAAMPPNISLLVAKKTNRGGRKGRGRLYLPAGWVPETNVGATGEVEVGWVADVTDQWEQVRTECVTADIPLVLHHSDGTAGSYITAFQMSSLVATQRRRIR